MVVIPQNIFVWQGCKAYCPGFRTERIPESPFINEDFLSMSSANRAGQGIAGNFCPGYKLVGHLTFFVEEKTRMDILFPYGRVYEFGTYHLGLSFCLLMRIQNSGSLENLLSILLYFFFTFSFCRAFARIRSSAMRKSSSWVIFKLLAGAIGIR